MNQTLPRRPDGAISHPRLGPPAGQTVLALHAICPDTGALKTTYTVTTHRDAARIRAAHEARLGTAISAIRGAEAELRSAYGILRTAGEPPDRLAAVHAELVRLGRAKRAELGLLHAVVVRHYAETMHRRPVARPQARVCRQVRAPRVRRSVATRPAITGDPDPDAAPGAVAGGGR